MSHSKQFPRANAVTAASLEEATRRLRPALPQGGGFYPIPSDAITRSCRQPSQSERRAQYDRRQRDHVDGLLEQTDVEHPLQALLGLAGLGLFFAASGVVLYALTNYPQ